MQSKTVCRGLIYVLVCPFPILFFFGKNKDEEGSDSCILVSGGGGICKTGSHLLLDVENIDRVEHGIMEQWGIMEHYKQTAPNPLIKTSKQLQR